MQLAVRERTANCSGRSPRQKVARRLLLPLAADTSTISIRIGTGPRMRVARVKISQVTLRVRVSGARNLARCFATAKACSRVLAMGKMLQRTFSEKGAVVTHFLGLTAVAMRWEMVLQGDPGCGLRAAAGVPPFFFVPGRSSPLGGKLRWSMQNCMGP